MNEIDFLDLDENSPLDDDGGMSASTEEDSMNEFGESGEAGDHEEEVDAELDEDDDDDY